MEDNNIFDNNKCAVIVSSCDSYQDSWAPFFTLFFRYWPDCPFPVYLISNNLAYNDDKVKTIAVGEDKGWATNMRFALDKIKPLYFIYLLEDVPFKKTVNTERILNLFSIMKREKAAYLRLYPVPGPDLPYKDNPEVGLISKEAPYRTSLMAAFWDTDIFRSLLVDDENAWEMELKGTERSRLIDAPFLSVKLSQVLKINNNPAIDYFATAIKKGKWQYDAVQFLESQGIKIDKTKRKIEPLNKFLLRKICRLPIIGRIINKILRIINKIKKI
ncbi:hypothetical protein KAU19_06040 [Candidatus Parcubacteria bacterium]|nr:hypothetical protein [Candidatus Parcubacteria bacterium]